MTRLILAIIVATLLWPTEHTRSVTTTSASSDGLPVREVLTVAHSVYGDLSSFCERNEDACDTGRQVVQSTIGKLQQFADSKISETTNDSETGS